MKPAWSINSDLIHIFIILSLILCCILPSSVAESTSKSNEENSQNQPISTSDTQDSILDTSYVLLQSVQSLSAVFFDRPENDFNEEFSEIKKLAHAVDEQISETSKMETAVDEFLTDIALFHETGVVSPIVKRLVQLGHRRLVREKAELVGVKNQLHEQKIQLQHHIESHSDYFTKEEENEQKRST